MHLCYRMLHALCRQILLNTRPDKYFITFDAAKSVCLSSVSIPGSSRLI